MPTQLEKQLTRENERLTEAMQVISTFALHVADGTIDPLEAIQRAGEAARIAIGLSDSHAKYFWWGARIANPNEPVP